MKKYFKQLITIAILILVIVFMLTPRPFILFFDGFFSNEICVNEHCFQKPEGWINTKNWYTIVTYIIQEDNKMKDEGYILESVDGRKVIIEALPISNDIILPPNVKHASFNQKCDYIYEDYPAQPATDIEIKNYGVTLFLPNDEVIKNQILAAICNE